MAKIYCVRCGADTGYTDATLVENKTRSFLPVNSGEECRVHICSVCWDREEIQSALDELDD